MRKVHVHGDTMRKNADVRDAMLLLVNACNDYQTRYLALAAAFRALQLYPVDQRVSICECDLQAEALKAYNDAEAAVEAQAKEVKSALEGSGPFLDVLTKFATRHYSEFEQFLPRPRPH
jgi:hypothetical protein